MWKPSQTSPSNWKVVNGSRKNQLSSDQNYPVIWGIIISQYKDPYESTSNIMECHKDLVHAAQLDSVDLGSFGKDL